MFNQILKEPLVHFVVLGALLLVVEGWLGSPGNDNSSLSVRVSTERKVALEKEFEARFQRSPSSEESAALIQHYINEEILLREGRARGMGTSDPVIRRRIVQQMTLLLEEADSSKAPTLDEIQAWINAEPQRYSTPLYISFEHVFFSRSKAGYQARAADTNNKGEPFPLGRFFPAISFPKLSEQFGANFANAVANQKLKQWSGVLESTLGLHRVKVTDRVNGQLPPVAQVRDKVVKDMVAARRKFSFKTGLQALRERYTVIVP